MAGAFLWRQYVLFLAACTLLLWAVMIIGLAIYFAS